MEGKGELLQRRCGQETTSGSWGIDDLLGTITESGKSRERKHQMMYSVLLSLGNGRSVGGNQRWGGRRSGLGFGTSFKSPATNQAAHGLLDRQSMS